MDQVCINNSTEIAGIAASVVAVVSAIANFVPEPEKIDNKFFRFLSRVIHFIALDVVTAKK